MNRIFLSLLALLFVFAGGKLVAQEMPEEQLEQQEEEQEEDQLFGELDEEDVEAFAEIFVKVRELERDFAEQLRNREDGEDASEMQREMTEKRLELIEEGGLDSESYRQIQDAMARNEELRDHVESLAEAYEQDN